MMSKIKKVFFVGVFGILYVSFVAQMAYAISLFGKNIDAAFITMGFLAVEWLVIISARYISKKSAGGRDNGNRDYNNGGGNRHFRR